MEQNRKQEEMTEQEAETATAEMAGEQAGSTAGQASNPADADPRSREELLAEVIRLSAELSEVQNRLLRISADFDNFRKRARQEKEELGKYAALRMVQEILPVLDNFRLAMAAETTDAESMKKGIDMVFRQFLHALEREGVTEMNAVGQPFDPNRHEAVMQVESEEHESGIVVEELRKGYLLHDKVIRPAMVKVAK
ncbi:nucleotide exchange factor GrpE [Effusibacillus lacus]|uniref:Protein GrpE n=1 Tax=Effusibacillus lacus TaxID=1348429 RepID=A0A292YQC2_9BACL|nr:nucleotide exchange factor GrpE [Effusibacillus lacus]TCS68773.1 molecular chaperone GrpE [Effusibacillus lacus]GAX90690.1 nucleotide exchange factor GrpE [Effusibacillus lacus]